MYKLLFFAVLSFSLNGYPHGLSDKHERYEERGKDHNHHNQHKHNHRNEKESLSLIPILKKDVKKCDTPCTVTFDASKSKAIGRAKIERYHFDFGDGETLVSYDPIVTHTYYEIPKSRKKYFVVRLQLESDKGKFSFKTHNKIKVSEGEEEVANQPPISDFSFIPQNPSVNDLVTLNSIASDDESIRSYEWFISDGRQFSGPSVGLTFTFPGTYSVVHRVKDSEGLMAESMAQITVFPKTEVISRGILTEISGISLKTFNELTLNIELKLNADLIQVSSGDLSATLNDFEQSIVLNGQSLSMLVNAKEGKNQLTISGLKNGLEVSETLEFYAGSKTITLRANDNSLNGEVVYYPKSRPSFKQKQSFQNGLLSIDNVPVEDVIFEVQTEFGVAVSVMSQDDVEGSIDLEKFSPVSGIDNNDFADGLDGWEVEGGEPTRALKISNGQVVNGDFNLRISGQNNLLIRRSFKSNASNKYLNLKFNYLSNSDDEYLIVFMVNKTTGEMKSRLILGKDRRDDLRTMSPYSDSISIYSSGANDIIQVLLKRVMDNQNVTVQKSRMKSKSIQSYDPIEDGMVEVDELDPNYDSNLSSFEVYPRTYSRTSCDTVNCNYDLSKNLFDEGTDYLSVGPNNSISKYSGNILGNYSIFAKFSGVTGDAQLIIEQPGSNTFAVSTGISLEDGFTRSSRESISVYQFSFNTNDISNFRNDMSLNLRLVITDENGAVHTKMLDNRLIPLSDYNASKVYGLRDPSLGGEFWAQKHTTEILNDIFSLNVDKKGFSINDISMLHAAFFSGHPSGHRDGQSVDYFTDHMWENETINGMETKVVSGRALTDIAELLKHSNRWSYVESILLTLNSTTRVNSAANKVARARCTSDNRLFKNVFRHARDHVTHGHLNLRRIPVVPSLDHSLFGMFRPHFLQSLHLPRTFSFRVPLETNPDMSFIWEIRNGDKLIEVIDGLTAIHVNGEPIGSSGALLERTEGQRFITYTFPTGGEEYKVNLVAVREIDREERCMEQSINIRPSSFATGSLRMLAEEEDLDIYCVDEWQTFRGREEVDPISGAKHIWGAVVSDQSTFEAGRFYVDSDHAMFCGQSVIKDSFSNFDGCAVGQSKEDCASIVVKGWVDTYENTFDASNGKIKLFGLAEVQGIPEIEPGLPERFTPIGDEILMDNSAIIPSDGKTIIIQDSHIIDSKIFDAAIVQKSLINNKVEIKNSAKVQQSLLERAKVTDTSKVFGAYVMALEEEYENSVVEISGYSEVRGFIDTMSKVEVSNSTLEKESSVTGASKLNKAFIEGTISSDDVDPVLFSSERVATVDNSGVLKKGMLLGRAHVLNQSFVSGDPTQVSYASVLGGQFTIKDGVWFGYGSYAGYDNEEAGHGVIEGDKVFIYNAQFAGRPLISSKIGGTLEKLLINGGSFFGTPNIVGTPQIIGGYVSGNAEIRDDAYLNGGVSDTSVIKDKAILINSSIYGDSSVSENAKLTDSSLQNKVKVSGTAQIIKSLIGAYPDMSYLTLTGTVIFDDCSFSPNWIRTGSYYSSGYFSRNTRNAPCSGAPVDLPPTIELSRAKTTVAGSTKTNSSLSKAASPVVISTNSNLYEKKSRDKLLKRQKMLVSNFKHKLNSTKRKSFKRAYNEVLRLRALRIEKIESLATSDRRPSNFNSKQMKKQKEDAIKLMTLRSKRLN